MNKIKLYIVPDQSDFDKLLTNKIKKFSSERNLFFSNLYNGHDTMTRLEKGKNFLRGTLLKKCKSTRDIYGEQQAQEYMQRAHSGLLDDHNYEVAIVEDEYQRCNNKSSRVKELRKNFENRMDHHNAPHQPSFNAQRKISTPFQKCEFSAVDLQKRLSMRERPTNAVEMQTPKRTLARHSFYLHRTAGQEMHAPFVVQRRKYSDENVMVRSNSTVAMPKTLITFDKCDPRNLPRGMRQQSLPPQPVAVQVVQQQHKPPSPHHPEKTMADRWQKANEEDQSYIVVRKNVLNCSQKSNTMLNDGQMNGKNGGGGWRTRSSFDDSTMMQQQQQSPQRDWTKVRKSNSVNKIDLDMLKYELDDFVDPKWRSNECISGYRSHRGLRRNQKELDLEQKIDLEIKMREGSAKLLAACNNPKNASKSQSSNGGNGSATSPHNTQMLEAAKNLLTSNERMTAYMAELQRRKRDRDTIVGGVSGGGGGVGKAKPTAKVSLSEIRMPLMWRDSDHFKNKGDHRRFAVFCLIKIGTEIYDTTLQCPVDRNLTDASFPDAILFTNVTPDFELKLEVYAVMMESDLSIASTPRKIKNTIHSSISRTVGKRLAANLKDELNNTKIGPKFDLIATAHLTLQEASDLPHTHDLCLSPNNAPNAANNKLPLFGHFCCRLAVQPDFMEQNTCSGALLMCAKGPTRPVDGFARLQAFRLDLWDQESQCKENIEPRRTLDVTRDSKVKARDCDIVISNMEEGTFEDYVFKTQTTEEASKWYTALKRCVKEHSQWDHIPIAPPMPLAVPGNSKHYFLRSARQGSLYDQVPILDVDNRNTTVTSTRPSVHDIFTIPAPLDKSPTLGDFRSRTYSSSRSSSHSSSTLSAGSSIGSISSRKSHWPFGSSK